MKNNKKGNWKKSEKRLFEAAQLSAAKRRGIGWFFAGVFFLAGIWLWGDFTVVLAIDEVPTRVQEDIFAQETEVSDTEQFIRWRSTRSQKWYHYDYPQSVIEAQDGSYVAAGYSSPVENTQYRRNAYVTKFNKNGTIAWDDVSAI